MESLDLGWRSALMFALSAPTTLAAVLIGWRGAERPASLLLAAILLLWSWQTVPFIIGFAGAYDVWPWLSFAPFSVELWFGPLFYLYAVSLSRPPRANEWWWLAPGVVQTAYYTVCFAALGSADAKFAFHQAVHAPYIARLETVLALGLGVFGVVAAWRETLSYRRWLETEHASADRFDPVWLRRCLQVMVGLVALWLGFEVWAIAIGGLRYVDALWFQVTVGGVLLWLAFEGLTRVELIHPKRTAPVAPAPPPAPLEIETIAEAVREGGWHRDPDLTVAKLARLLSTNASYVSRAVNRGAGVNFNRFINQIRVDEVCKTLRSGDSTESLLEVALGAGFASKATFNRVFKELVGSTPSAWRRANRTAQNT